MNNDLMPKTLSIIIPTYNMEGYLDKCLSSLVVGDADSELMQSLEVLVVNDGSTDRSSEIAHRFEQQYPETFSVIDKENGNYGSCVNVALPLVTGKYVKILDADDYFDTHNFESYLSWLDTIDVDMVVTDMARVSRDYILDESQQYHFDIEPYKPLRFAEYESIYHRTYIHYVTYRSTIFQDLDYHQTEGIYYTDMEWIHLPMSRVETFAYYPKTIYYYLLGRPGQSMDPAVHTPNLWMIDKGILNNLEVYTQCKNNGAMHNGKPVNMDFLHHRCVQRLHHVYTEFLFKVKDQKARERMQTIDNVLQEYYPEMYKEMDSLVYPGRENTIYPWHFHILSTYRRFGPRIMNLQLWFVNHYMGLVSRMKKGT